MIRIAAISLLCFSAAPILAAQDARMHVTLVAHGGVLSQTGPFRQDFSTFIPGLVSSYRFDRGGALGASVELGRTRFPLGARLSISQSASLGLDRTPGSNGAPLFEPASGRVTTATIAALLEPRRTCIRRVCPRLMVGGGVKRYGFDADLLLDDIIDSFAEDQIRPTLQLGLGLRATVGRVEVMTEINDFSNDFQFGNSTYPSKRTHDTIVSLGVGFRFAR